MKRKAEKRATEKMSKGDLQNEDPELVKEILEKAERLRATERVSLKHRNTSKWARQLIAKGGKNPEAKKLLQDQLRISRTLTKKIEEAASDEEMETLEQGQGMNEDVEELETYGKLFTSEDNPWRLEANEKENSQEIMSPLDYDLSTKLHRPQPVTAQEKSVEDYKESEPSDAERNESEEEFELQPVSHVEKKNGKEGTKKKDKKAANRTEKKKKRKSDLLDGDNTSAPVNKSKKMGKASKRNVKKSAGNGETQNLGQIGEQKDSVKKRKTKNVRRKKSGEAMTLNEITKLVAGSDISNEENSNSLTMHDTAHTKTKDICVDPKKVFQIEDSRTDLDKEPGNLLQQKRIDIQQAFANDDVVDEFVQEKNEIEEASKPKDIDLSLPGWGSWAGAGLRPSEKKKKAFIKETDQTPPRKDKGLSHVIISEEKNKWLAKSQVSSVPYPFNSHLQLERSMRNPIGKHWNTSTTVGQLTKPRVSTLIGTIIEPIKATKDVKQKKPESKKGKMKGQESSGRAIQNK